MKVREKFFASIIGLSAVLLIANPIKANAALQANGNSPTQQDIAYWIENIRKMEEVGGTLGLTDTINTTIDTTNYTYLTSGSASNNLDIHMEKNSEYGAMAILSASAYGNPNVIEDGGTTTGNKSGVYINMNSEWVLCGTISDLQNYSYASAKYKDVYTGTYIAKAGDAINETKEWHNSVSSAWALYIGHSGLLRAYRGSIFSYYTDGNHEGAYALYTKWHPTRAVVVIGNGF